MLTNMKVRCINCKQTSYFHVHSWKGRVNAAIYTECPKCHKYDDVFHFPLEIYDKYLKDILAGREFPGTGPIKEM